MAWTNAFKALTGLEQTSAGEYLAQRVAWGFMTLEHLDNPPPNHLNPAIYRNVAREWAEANPKRFAEMCAKWEGKQRFRWAPGPVPKCIDGIDYWADGQPEPNDVTKPPAVEIISPRDFGPAPNPKPSEPSEPEELDGVTIYSNSPDLFF